MNSLKSRLILYSTLVLLLFGALTALALERAFHVSALNAQEEKMHGFIYTLLGAIDLDRIGQLRFEEAALQNPRFLSKDSTLSATVFADNGTFVWKSPSYRLEKSPAPLETGAWSFENHVDHFSLGLGVNWIGENQTQHKFTVFVIDSTEEFDKQIHFYRQTLWHWLILIAIGLLVSLVGVLSWGLKPLKTVAVEIEEIREGKREALTNSHPKELQPLLEGLTSLMRHERGQKKRYREALDDLAHSLKTPLAALKGMADEKLSDQIKRIDQILEYQVRRASSAGRSAFIPPILVRPLLEKIVSALEKVYREKNVQFRLLVPADLNLRMDQGDLMEIVGNLGDNAAKWCKKQVQICVSTDLTHALITVEDDGPGFPKENRSALLERGVRADARVPGQGIGLSVIQNLAHLYEGTLELNESPLGGAKVSLRFPR